MNSDTQAEAAEVNSDTQAEAEETEAQQEETKDAASGNARSLHLYVIGCSAAALVLIAVSIFFARRR